MKFLLFDESAISIYLSENRLQSIEYQSGAKFVDHLHGIGTSEIFHKTAIKYTKNGILFVGPKNNNDTANDSARHIFCIDLEYCKLLEEETNPARLLTIIQRAFRLVLKIWNRYPFTASERINGSKSILFPFSNDRHRLVIERSNKIPRLEKRGIVFPLLAYKYNAEEPGQNSDIVNTDILRDAGEQYIDCMYNLMAKLEAELTANSTIFTDAPLNCVESSAVVERDDFVFWDYDRQLEALTESQKCIVECDSFDSPMRVNGAAGTGKTAALILRAYRLLKIHRENGTPFHIVFFAHSESTSSRNQDVFSYYPDSSYYLNKDSEQSICFTTLLSFCCEFAKIDHASLIDGDAENAKTYQLLLIDEIVQRAYDSHRIATYRPIISPSVYSLFDLAETDRTTLVTMLQHEFSIQIKGRTDCLLENYIELEPIPNGIPCYSKTEKELIFSLFTDYQRALQLEQTFDIDDVTIETISRLNAPMWRRHRQTEGYDYIFVDEMHLFNFNEQSVFHFLSKDLSSKKIPICFALDYCQAIGDRGDIMQDYVAGNAFGEVAAHSLHTLFRNSPPIVDFCASIAASGTLMFGASFSNPYQETQYQFTHAEEQKMQTPILHMYANDDAMIADLSHRLDELTQTLQCKQGDIAIISFDGRWLTDDGIAFLKEQTGKAYDLLDNTTCVKKNHYVLASPYAINGLEFDAVLLLGVDDGRLPQTAGTGDVSRNFLMYSAYNMLYLSASRAKFRVVCMGTTARGISSCLDHSIKNSLITVEYH